MSIPASNLVNVIPGVIGAGGNPLKFNGVILSTNQYLAAGPPISLPNYDAVAAFFGSTSIEAKMAKVYFSGFNNSTQIPSALLFARYPEVAIAAFLLGGPAATLAALKLFTTGTLSLTIDGTASTISSIDLSAQTSLAAIAADLTAALSPAKSTITYNSTINAFVCTSNTTGALSTVAFATGTMAAALGFTSAAGGSLSQGAAATDPTTFMNALVNFTQNWVSFSSTFLPIPTDMEAFSEWVAGRSGRYLYAAWDNDATAAGSPGSFAGFGKWLANNQPDGTVAVWAGASPNVTDGPELAAFVMGTTAAINFNALNGRITYAFKGNPNLTPMVTDATTAANLQANGYNFYGDYATANQQFLEFQNGQISGDNLWIDEYVDAIWLSNALQLSIMSMLAQVNSLPYNTEGYTMVTASVQGPITQAVQNGVICTGVAISPSELALANSQAGLDISSPLQSNGYFFQVVPVTDPTVRAGRTSPVCNLWYTNGGSIQQIVLNSINIQ